jgi:hypothetical protein
VSTKYWYGTSNDPSWILANGPAATTPGIGDIGVLGGTLTVSGVTLPQSGTVSFFGLTAEDIGALSVVGSGPWTLEGTGGADDAIDSLTVAMGAWVEVNSTIAVKNVVVEQVSGATAPATIYLNDGLPPGAVIDFPGETISSYSTSQSGIYTTIAVNSAAGNIANVSVAGNVALSGQPISDGNGGTEFIVSGTQPYIEAPDFILDVRSANDINRTVGESIIVGDSDVQPNENQGTTVTATSIVNPATGLPYNTLTVPFVGSAAIPNQTDTRISFDPTNPADAWELQPWTLTLTNGTSALNTTTPSLVGVTPPPFASSVTYSGTNANPTFTWAFPSNSVNGVFFDIYEDNAVNADGGADLVYTATLAGNAGTYTVPSELDGGLTLQDGVHYTLDIYGVVTRNGSDNIADITNPNSAAWSESYFDFEPIAGAAVPTVYLPTVVNGAYNFNMTVVSGQTYFIDPAIATGYSYTTGAGNPNFASVLLPAIQTTPYLVTFLVNGKQETVSVAPNTVYTFASGGVSAFTVTGISQTDNLAPADATAFVTGLTFVSSGTFTGTQTPLVDPGPTAGGVTASALLGQSVDLTSAILAQVTPGLIGDTETLTAFGTTSDGGQIALTNGDLTYTAQSATLAHIPANGSLTDTFAYTVTDQLGDSSTGTVQVTVSNPAINIEGPRFGFDTIREGSKTNIVTANGYFNTVYEGGGNDVVNAGAGFGTVYTGSGDVVTNLQGVANSVFGGNGYDAVNILGGGFDQVTLGTGHDTIAMAPGSSGYDVFTLDGSDASVSLSGADNIMFIRGGTDNITDNSQDSSFKIGPEGGVVNLNNFLSDRHGVIDLTGGVGGYSRVSTVLSALQSDGHGGVLLSLGASGHIDFVGVPLGALTAARFSIE